MAEDAGVVTLESPETSSLMALLMRGLLVAAVRDPALEAKVAGMRGDVEVRAADMIVTLRFGGGRLAIVTGPSPRPRARVKGTLPALLGVVTGGGLIAPVLRGDVRIGGNPFVLLGMLPLITAAGRGGKA